VEVRARDAGGAVLTSAFERAAQLVIHLRARRRPRIADTVDSLVLHVAPE
jgi:propanediol dehydratase small subunit